MRQLANATAHSLNTRGYTATVQPVLRTANIAAKSVEVTNATQRNIRISGNIIVTNPAQCNNRNIIILDDIITTGATMRQCITALNNAGAHVITALALASVEKPVSESHETDEQYENSLTSREIDLLHDEAM